MSFLHTFCQVCKGFKLSSGRGHSITDALVYMLQAIYEAVDSGDSAARIFFADFSKGFDLFDHNILITELRNLEVSEIILGWISAFLVDLLLTHHLQRFASANQPTGYLSSQQRGQLPIWLLGVYHLSKYSK